MSELRHQKIIDRVHYMYLQTDGTIEFPNSFEGDLLKIAYGTAVQSIKQPQLNENQQIVLDWLEEDYSKNSYMSPFGTIYDTIRYREIKIRMLSKKEQAEVLQAFSQWALEQEEAE
ncbi:hypothetical protein QuyetLC_22590 [Bacillus anthracis]|uniref:Uncharacterized protein n=1 Tax=Bacillus anthracis TaxID=1392 RepID=A0A640NPZ8_BACAN|nr:hypothetical protein QuyetLC_22590 [Bacillus anthracis]